ncbi:splicing factor, putative [Entamoeba histolytica HM-1:IMSS-B]|uniref:Splicing factor, putative n=6 Tax=Entamoeba histolytica TaxID=5759 RepID=C4LWT7_ENTH1|nr:splicing factor, putative [Entamoeba histolytica HM-1:IMSS]XP_654979.1 splicing factor, putative [Entamoeba histolytica HM-1:IMSS]EMD46590.1 splicing factor, putative [Entamoeba histolytica KU27]EMH74549.1 splicing factor, putative [Entamoeba histolytica HM-1:IMSS-B]EMS17018.1 splicing factor, putative [Entamoeba histolytica HM-3:IMSS]ENY65440.1 splicing factor, putative [Entamoeba histolytica HM-1:IMSS-A]GAT93180.1 splicing factor putative [Entamoeba histolytica]|eukprot:XP_650284.1 splicing factor, putative [Entamoeba histolytica HM-1:IMSS]
MPPRPIKNRFEIHRPYITQEEDEIIKLTAQYTARNGSNFVKTLAEREQKNPTFAFLHKNHPNYPYFAQLCESYNQCLHPKQQYIQFLNKTMGNTQILIKYSKMRADYEKEIEEIKKKNEEDKKREEELNLSINWNDFVVVETIDFNDFIETEHQNIFLDEMEQNTEEEIKQETKEEENQNDNDEITKIKKGNQYGEVKQECPLCHRLIPLSEMDKHMKIELSSKTMKSQQK